jgi:hypothetical protein
VNDIDLKRKKFAGIVKIAIGALAIAVLAPAIMLLVKGIIGIAIAGTVGLLIVNGAPVISMKLANWKVKAIVSEAKTNPIETMVNIANDRADKLKEALQRIGDLSASVKNFADKVVGFKKQWPNDAAMFDQAVANANKVLEKWKGDYKVAKQALEAYLLEIEKCRAVNEMAVEMAALNKMAQMDSDKLMEELKSKTAIDEVSRRMNSAMAQLETSLLEEVNFSVAPGKTEEKPLGLQYVDGDVPEMRTLSVKQQVKV